MPIEPEHEERSRAAEESCLWGRGPDRSLVELGGLEPPTSSMPLKRSPG